MQLLLSALSVGLAVAIGYASRRASLCTVRAVADAMSHRGAGLLCAFARAALWATAVAGALVLWLGVAPPRLPVQQGLVWSLAGGFLFGAGAAINGGCSLSTLQRLVDGDRSLVLTLLAFCAGAFAWSLAERSVGAPPLGFAVSPWAGAGAWHAIALGVLLLWCVREVLGMRKTCEAREARHAGAEGAPYAYARVGLLLGVAGGVLYTAQGAWTYTNYLRAGVATVGSAASGPAAFHALLVCALLLGMYLASAQRTGDAPAASPIVAVWRARLAGGFLMGVGAALVPGGNDTLILAGIPSLSMQALAAYLALLLGIAAVLHAMRCKKRGTHGDPHAHRCTLEIGR